MTDRVILRFGLAGPPSYMRPGELAAGTDMTLWLAGLDGVVQQVLGGGGGGGTYTLTAAKIAAALGYTPYDAGANASGFLNSAQAVALVTWTNLAGKPAFATVATTGAYADLTGKPTLFDGTWTSLTGKPTFATVATTGAYADLSGKPTLGGAAALNVGTAAGTVAAGNDPRFTTTFTRAAVGVVPASGGTTGTSNYLREDGTWAVPPSAGGGASVGSATPLVDGTAAAGTSVNASREDHVHPTDTSRYAASNPSGYQTAGQVSTAIGAGTAANVSGTVAVANGGTGATSAATARSNLGVATGGATISFGLGAVVANGSIPIDIPYGYTLTSMVTNVGTAGGSFAVTVSIGGTPVTGLNGIAVSSSADSTATATAANVGAAGQALVTIASTTGSPTDSKIILRWTR